MVLKGSTSFEILLVEDNSTDVLLTREALARIKTPNRLHVIEDGAEAISLLHKEGQYANLPRPDLILLDLNLAIKSGYDVLAEIKGNRDFCSIPVIVLSTSDQESDINKAYGLNANCYIVKPVNFGRFREIVLAIENFWLSVAVLPPKQQMVHYISTDKEKATS